jgi:GNAT superfamily N-acetyltransferase
MKKAVMSNIFYRQGNELDLDQVIDLYRRSTLGERRPVNNRPVMEGMLRQADLVFTAWHEETLVGIARTLTDFCYVAYLADLAVDLAYQKRGIGRALIERTRAALDPTCFITLLAAPAAQHYYPKVGFSPNPRAWMLAAAVNPAG